MTPNRLSKSYWRLLAMVGLASLWIMCTLPIGPDRLAARSRAHRGLGASSSLDGTGRDVLMNQKAMSQKGQKLLVTFTYYESVSARANLKYFLKHGLHDAADFVFIFNGDTPQGQEKAAKLIPKRNNIKIVERNNTCFDLGATGEVLKKNKMWKKYDKFIVMNASLRGPFLPHWSDSCWSDLFLAKVTDEVKVSNDNMFTPSASMEISLFHLRRST
nr:uncharacterized protein CTRU02_09793 [Colletotrichum truncatum]KAF6787980.1 hypothetical protein CTRU02_09793 [Colletotrichum truncatum]